MKGIYDVGLQHLTRALKADLLRVESDASESKPELLLLAVNHARGFVF